MKRLLLTVSTLALAAWCGTLESSAQSGKSWNFDSDSPGTIAKGFTNDLGAWQVAADASAPSKPNVLAQTAKSSNADFNVSLIDGTSYKDVDVTVSMKAVAGRLDQGGGLVWRAQGAADWPPADFSGKAAGTPVGAM